MSTETVERPNLSKTICFLFSGKAGVGKTYCADVLLNLLKEKKLSALKFPFAFGVKAVATFMEWDGNEDQRGRRFLQDIGRIGREYSPDVWVKSTFIRVEESVGYPYDSIVIDDWRFNNEISYIKDNELLYEPITIRIVAPKREMLKGTMEYYEPSETELDGYDFLWKITNDEDGTQKVEKALRAILSLEISRNLR